MADEHGILTIHILVGDVGDDAGDQSQTHVLVALGAYVRGSHLAYPDGVKGLARILKCDEDAIGIDLDVHVEGMRGNLAPCVSDNVVHQFLAADVYLEGLSGRNPVVSEERVYVGKGAVHVIDIIAHGAVESGTTGVAGYHREGRDARLDETAAHGGETHLEEQHQHAGQHEAPPQFNTLHFSYGPHTDDEHHRLRGGGDYAGHVVTKYLVGAEQYLRDGKRNEHQRKDAEHTVDFNGQFGALLYAEELTHDARHIHDEYNQRHQRGNDDERLLDEYLKTAEVTLTDEDAADGKHRLYDTVDEHIR